MAETEMDEQLAWLTRVELAAGAEGLEESVAGLSRADLERLLCLAVVEVMDANARTKKEVERLARRSQEHRR